ncbi:hypothetical protein GGR51DRAFT_574683 [Nemania sp. FL0031]|nr:hypothetical protein GGR51DRAFT_574683 [Nemania sp. FL0031]
MDRLRILKPPASESRPKAASTTRPRPRDSVVKTRRKHRSARKKNVIFCPTQESYSCQLSLLILLHTRSYGTLRPIRQDDSQRSIEFDYTTLPRASERISFGGLLEALCYRGGVARLPYLEALEESLVDALQLLHSHSISFPVSAEEIEFSRRWGDNWGDLKSLRLFFPHNKEASWASDRLPPTWKADQLSSARSIFFIPKLLVRLGDSSGPTLLDLATQQALTAYLKENPTFHHDLYCLGVAPMTAELAHQMAHNLAIRNKTEKSRQVLESFFGGPMPLPEPGTSPHTICEVFSDLRARAIESGEHRSSSTALGQDLKPKLLLDSPALVTRFICCRAKVASLLRDPDRKQWWLTAMDLYDAFLSSQEPSSVLERICAFDLLHYRDRST